MIATIFFAVKNVQWFSRFTVAVRTIFIFLFVLDFVFHSRTFATFRAVLEFAACHGCIEFSAKRGTKLLQAKEKIVSSQARKEKKKKKKTPFCATFQSKDEKW